MTARKITVIVCVTVLLSACTTTPKLQIIKSAGVSMQLERPASYVFSVEYSPNGKSAFSGSLDNLVTIWDLETGTRSKILKAQIGPGVSSLAFSRDGKYLLTGTKGGGDVRLWDVENGREVGSLPGHSFTEAMEAFIFSPDGRYAISGGSYTIKQWDMETRKELRSITHASFFDRNQSYAMAFLRMADLLSSKGLDTSVSGTSKQEKGCGFMVQILEVKDGAAVI